MISKISGLPGGGRTLDLTDVIAAYDDPTVRWAITQTGHHHHLTREGTYTLCGRRAIPSSEPSWPHGVCRRCLDARLDTQLGAPATPKSTRPRKPKRRYAPVVERNLREREIDQRLNQCNRLYSDYWGRWMDAHGDLVWLKGTERPNVDPIARADARTSCADMNGLWRHIWRTEVIDRGKR